MNEYCYEVNPTLIVKVRAKNTKKANKIFLKHLKNTFINIIYDKENKKNIMIINK